MNLPVEVIEAAREGRCLIFLGSRASGEAAEKVDAPYPDAAELARELGWKRPKSAISLKQKGIVASVEEGAATYAGVHGRPKLIEMLRSRLTGSWGPTETHRALFRRFPLLFTTAQDDLLERATDLPLDVLQRGDRIPDPDPARRILVKLRGGFDRPDTLLLTRADRTARALGPEARKQLRSLLRANVVFFVGYRPDEEEFEALFTDLSDAYGGELPRCHLAVAQGAIDDYLWQKWVLRGLLLFTADPSEAVEEMESSLR